jgi:hypothetical protein
MKVFVMKETPRRRIPVTSSFFNEMPMDQLGNRVVVMGEELLHPPPPLSTAGFNQIFNRRRELFSSTSEICFAVFIEIIPIILTSICFVPDVLGRKFINKYMRYRQYCNLSAFLYFMQIDFSFLSPKQKKAIWIPFGQIRSA